MKRIAFLLLSFLILQPTLTSAQIERSCPAGSVPADAPQILIGAVVSQSGRFAGEGEALHNGYQLWADAVNQRFGGIDVSGTCHQVELVVYDDRSDPNAVSLLLETLIIEDQVDFVLGPFSTELTRAATLVTEPENVLMIGGAGVDEGLFSRGFRTVFAILTPAESYTRLIAEQAASLNAQTAIIVYPELELPAAIARAATVQLEASGIQVLATEQSSPQSVDFSGLFAGFSQLNPDLFIGIGYLAEAQRYVNTSIQVEFSPAGYFLSMGLEQLALTEARNAPPLDGVLGATAWLPSNQNNGLFFESAADYAGLYRSRYGVLPGSYAAQGTAIGIALQAAIEAAGSLRAGEVQTALQRLDLDTFYGPINFDQTGRSVDPAMPLIQIQAGAPRVIAAAEDSIPTTDIIWPFPGWFN